MANFVIACDFVLSNEGGLSDNKNDHGGITNFGISAHFLDHVRARYPFARIGNIEDVIRELTIEQAREIYKKEFWLPVYELIKEQSLCNYVFDMAVNHAPNMAHKLVQRALWAVYHTYHLMPDDGIFGNHTLEKLNESKLDVVSSCLMATRADYYRLLAITNHSQDVFLKGWLTRAYRIN